MSKVEAEINREILIIGKDHTPRLEESLSQSQARKLLPVGTKPNIPDLNAESCFDSEGKEKEKMEEMLQTLTG